MPSRMRGCSMARRMIVECENGDRYEHQLEDGHRLKITGKGAVWLIKHGEKPITTEQLESPAVKLYELAEVDG